MTLLSFLYLCTWNVYKGHADPDLKEYHELRGLFVEPFSRYQDLGFFQATRAIYTRPIAHSISHLATAFPATATPVFVTETLEEPRKDPKKFPALPCFRVISYKKRLGSLHPPNINTSTVLGYHTKASQTRQFRELKLDQNQHRRLH